MNRPCPPGYGQLLTAVLAVFCTIVNACMGTPAIETLAMAMACNDLSDVGVGRPREIRMVALYTQGAAAEAGMVGNNIENEIELAFVEMNDVFLQSEIPVRAVLTHMEQVTLTEPQADGDILTQLIAGTGTLAVAHSLRTQYYADIVALITTSSGGLTRAMLAPAMAARDQAFVVAGRYPMGQQFTLTHEVGHVLGGVDGRPTDPAGLPHYRYAFGHYCLNCVVDGLLGWHTIMGKPVLSSDGVSTTVRIGRFSNPDVAFQGTVTGSSINPFADNRETLTYTSSLVAAFQYTSAWFAALGAEGPWFEKRVDRWLMPDIRIGDFNNDRQADAFRVDATTNKWYVSYSAAQPWLEVFLDPRKVPLVDLRFADFDGNGSTDVFYADIVGKQWLMWRGGTDWEVLNATAAASAGIPVTQLAFGNIFGGDREADVFWSDVATDTWKVSRSGTQDWHSLQSGAALKIDTDQLRLADFTNDGVADVFRSDVSAQTWFVSKGGTAPWEPLNGPDGDLAVAPSELAIGDFNGDGFADVIKPTGTAWGMASAGKGPLQLVKLSCARINNMALGDFDGDGSIDVLRAGIRP